MPDKPEIDERIMLLEKQLKEIRKENKSLSQILNNANSALVKISSSGILQYANKAFLDLINEPFLDIKGKPFKLSMFHNIIDEENGISEFLEKMPNGQRTETSFISRNQTKDGQDIWIWWIVKPRFNTKGICKAFIITGIDISKRKEAEKQIHIKSNELLTSELRFRNMSENIPFGIFICDSEGKNEFVNQEYCRLTGLSFEDALGEKWLQAIHPADLMRVKSRWEKGIKRSPVNYNIKYQIKNARTHKSIRAHAIAKEMKTNGKVTGYVGIIEDITKKEKLLDKLKSYELIIRNSGEQMSQIGKGYKYLVVNDSYVKAHNMKKHEIEGNTVESLWGKELFEGKIKHRIDEAFSGKQVRYQEWFFYHDVGNRYMDVTYQPVFGSRGQVESITVNSSDITDLKNTQIELEKAKDEAVKANKAKSEFLANMSHEIRTPLNSVIGFTELLELQITDPSLKKYLKSVKSGGRSLLTIINDILDLSKIEAGRMELKYEPFNIRTLIEEINQIFYIQFEKKNLYFEIIIQPEMPDYFLLDEIRLRQVLFNLVGNAVKFTEKGGVKLIVDGGERSLNQHFLKIIVRDTGIGIPKDQQMAIFSAFKQQAGQNTRRYGGTGLGLTISKKLIEAMKGTISLESVENQYSEFTILFENVKTIAKHPREKDTYASEGVEVVFEEANIALIDKDINNRQLIHENFTGSKLNILSISDVGAGISAILKEKIDLVLIDINIKDLDALCLISELKSSPDYTRIPIIAMSTGFIDAKNSGFDALISKPINRSQLILTLSYFLKHQKIIKSESNVKNFDYQQHENKVANHPDIEIIKNEIVAMLFPQWQKAAKEELSDDIEKFATDLEAFSQKYQIEYLFNYAKKLQENINSFDLEEISTNLKLFPLLIKNILE
jgi:PAS domain S-box-containing protein